MKNSILLIRHAQSANNALPESQRVPDPGLTELGHRQAQRLADGIKRFPVTQAILQSLFGERSIQHGHAVNRLN